MDSQTPTAEARRIEGVLAQTVFLRDAAAAHRSEIAGRCRVLGIRRNQVIVQPGARVPGIFAVAAGRVKLSLCLPGNRHRALEFVEAGQTFGEACAITGNPTPYEARAHTDCELVRIPVAEVFLAIDRDPRLARPLLNSVAERCLQIAAELRSAALLRGAQRLAWYLRSIDGQDGNGTSTLQLPATKTIIASRLDMKKETLSRLLKQLATRGLISVGRHEITILDRARLAELAESP